MLVCAVEEIEAPATRLADQIAAFTRAARKPAEDPFLALIFERMPADVARSFTPAQLDALKAAFGARA